ncbi:MAG: DUF2075 domain-containing protein [Candidatus Pacebacteria bacterium]|nr:DUF2075 domain-containing protein [Candidatus Paceibacterota bacterium]
MSQIKTFPFDKNNFNEIRAYRFGKNWPVVYVLENGKDVYVGQAINAHRRLKQHSDNPEKQILKLKTAHILSDEEFNVSAALDVESWLIQYMSADQVFTLHNKNGGLKNHNYYDRPKYKAKFEDIWKQFLEMGIAKSTLEDLKNTDLFKYSPYKSLTDDQLLVARKIFKDIKSGNSQTFIVNGKPGTGKTILATYLFKFLKEQEETKNFKMALVVPMTSLRKTIKKVFGKIKGLSSGMVVGPNDVTRDMYDLIIVDEAHRLQRRRNIMGMGAYDNVNRFLNLPAEATNLDWVMKCSKNQIFFYDENQSIKPADVRKGDFEKLNAKHYTLSTQMRVEAGEEYIEFIEALFDLKVPQKTNFGTYDFKIYDNVEKMVSDIKEKDKKHGLSRVVAGYAWPWHTKKKTKKYDIEIGDYKGVWNSTATDWVNSPNAVNEVGCIHTVQGCDLNYVGVIIGPEFGYDTENKKFFVDREKYLDRNGRAGVHDLTELEQYVKNIYKTILTRGICGTFLYVCDEGLRSYLKNILNKKVIEKPKSKIEVKNIPKAPIESIYFNRETVKLPLFESIGCGEFMIANSIPEDFINIDKNLVRSGAKYFTLRVSGDSMNLAGINDGDIVLCQKDYNPPQGKNVVALIGEDATIKEYWKEGSAVILKPKSNNPKHQIMKFTEDGEVFVQGVVLRVLKYEDYEE